MRKLLVLLLSLVLGTAAFAAAPTRDWRTVVRPAPAGGFVVGNPAAKVKLVEYISYTCPHCRHFGEQSQATLMDTWVRDGSTSVEVRNQIHDKIDFVAVILAHCLPAPGAARYHDAVYAAQDQWYQKAAEYDQSGAVAALPTDQARAKAFAVQSGLADLARKAGLTQAALDRCFADQAAMSAVAKNAQAIRQDVDSTPAFEINGKLVLHVTWAELEPQLRAAGAK